MAKTKPAPKNTSSAFEQPWDPSDLGSVLSPVDEPLETYTPSSPADQLRAAIAADPERHDQWFQLSQYRPLPKRVALGIAASWRRAKPAAFNGDRTFQARIMPVDQAGRGGRSLVITKETHYAVAVFYPAHREDSAQ